MAVVQSAGHILPAGTSAVRRALRTPDGVIFFPFFFGVPSSKLWYIGNMIIFVLRYFIHDNWIVYR